MQSLANINKKALTIAEAKQELRKQGYGPKRAYAGARVIKVTVYSWPGFKVSTSMGQTFTVSSGSFKAYVCTYPKYETNISTVTTSVGERGGYYEETLEEKLGGNKEMLGV